VSNGRRSLCALSKAAYGDERKRLIVLTTPRDFVSLDADTKI
jgi:hypothetical protein